MATLTIYNEVGNKVATIRSSSSTYSTARGGTGTTTLQNAGAYWQYPGQRGTSTYHCDIVLKTFDTSGIESDWIINSVSFNTTYMSDYGDAAGRTMNVREHDGWDGEDDISTSDFITGANAGSKTLLASTTIPDGGTSTITWTSNSSNLSSWLNKSGYSSLFFSIDGFEDNEAPTSPGHYVAQPATSSGRSSIVIDYSVPNFPHLAISGGNIIVAPPNSGTYLVRDGAGYKTVTGTETIGALYLDSDRNIREWLGGTLPQYVNNYNEKANELNAIGIFTNRDFNDSASWWQWVNESDDGNVNIDFFSSGTRLSSALSTPGGSFEKYRYCDADYTVGTVYFDDNALAFSGGQHSIVWWVRSKGSPQNTNAVHFRNGEGTLGYGIRQTGSTIGSLEYFVYEDGTKYTASTSGSELSDDTWHMLMATYTGTHLKLYTIDNGSASEIASQSYSGTFDVDDNFLIMGGQGVDYTYTDVVDQIDADFAGIALFDYSLSTSQFESLYEASLTP